MYQFDREAFKQRRARLGYVEVKPIVEASLVRETPKPKLEIKHFENFTPEPIETIEETPIVKKHNPSINTIIKAVSKEFDVNPYQLIGPRRYKHLLRARHVAGYLCRELTYHSLPLIAKFMGGRDHTTIMNSFHRAQYLMEKDPELKERVDRLRAQLLPEE